MCYFTVVLTVICILFIYNRVKHKISFRVYDFVTIYFTIILNLGFVYNTIEKDNLAIFVVPILIYWFARFLAWIYKSLTKDEEDCQEFLTWF